MTARALLRRVGPDALQGPHSIGLLAAKGYPLHPAVGPASLSEDRRYADGYTVFTYGSHRADGIDAIQLEFGRDHRANPRLSEDVAEALIGFMRAHGLLARQRAWPSALRALAAQSVPAAPLRMIDIWRDSVDIERFMQGYKSAWEQRDDTMFAALFAEDGEYHNTPFAVQRGHAQLVEYWQRVKLQQDVQLNYEVLATTAHGGLARWHVTYQVASEELFQIWARSTGTNLVARKPGDPLPRMVLDGVLQAEFDGRLCRRARIWWHSMPLPT